MPDGITTKRRTKLLGTAATIIQARHPTILLYGPSGVGKTVLTTQFPDVYFMIRRAARRNRSIVKG